MDVFVLTLIQCIKDRAQVILKSLELDDDKEHTTTNEYNLTLKVPLQAREQSERGRDSGLGLRTNQSQTTDGLKHVDTVVQLIPTRARRNTSIFNFNFH